MVKTKKITELVEDFKCGSITIEENLHKFLDEAKKINSSYNYFNVICETEAVERARLLDSQLKKENAKAVQKLGLLGIPISVKDAICVKGIESTAGSRILKGYKPLMNATAVQKCLDQGAIVIGKTAQDEFGFGGFAVNVGVDFKIPKNPFDPERSTGGSSGGCAGFTQKTSFPHFSLAESTGGSIAMPATLCGVFGLCPTYGKVSRFGLIDYGNTLDKIGPMAKTAEETAIAMSAIAGFDEKDPTTLNMSPVDYTEFLKKDIKKMRIGVIKEALGDGINPEIERKTWDAVKKLEQQGAEYNEISLELPIKHGVEVYYIIATCEASTNLAKYCGLRYGQHKKIEPAENFNEYSSKVRSKHFGDEAKRRILLGTFARMSGFRDAYYIKALKIRTLITNEYLKAFKNYDILVTPTSPILPPKFSEIQKLTPLQNYMLDILTVSPNLAGLPHFSVPVGKSSAGLPIGAMLIANHNNEGKLIQAAKKLESKGAE